MIDKIEKLYKKKSPYIKITKGIFWIYFIMIILMWICNLFKLYIPMIILLIISFSGIKRKCEKELDSKLYISFKRKTDDELTLPEIINGKEKSMFKDFFENEKKYNEKTLECILEHYRVWIKPKIIGDNFWSILSIVISIALVFITKDGFNINGFSESIPYILCLIIMVATVYYSFQSFVEIKKFLKGEDGMIERLEEIFTEIYIDCVNENEIKQKPINTRKKNIIKRKKQEKFEKNVRVG